MLAAWPVVACILFATMKPVRGLVWSVLGAYLLLPVGTSFEIPVVPLLDKTSIGNLSILLCCMIFVREKWLGVFRRSLLAALIALFIITPFLTALNNGQSLHIAERYVPAMTPYDALAQSALNFIALIPFIAGYGLLRTEARHAQFLGILAAVVLAYSILMIVEIRLSPQIHRWAYGFFPHSFGQQMRGDGFRPVVFLGHGLLVAILCAMGIAAVIARWRLARGGRKQVLGAAAVYLSVLMILCKSLGAALLIFIWAPVLAFLRARRIALMAGLTCLLVLIYPGMRSLDLVPVESIAAAADAYSEERGGSLGVRFKNEEELLTKAAQKPLFGWGSWGRNRLYSEEDGRDLSITDGAWIIVLGTWGWIGYGAIFGLLCFGAVRLFLSRRARREVSLATASLAAILALNLLDSIPNDSIRPITWLLAGALAARLSPHEQRPALKAAERPHA